MRIALKTPQKQMHLTARGGLTSEAVTENHAHGIEGEPSSKITMHITTDGGLDVLNTKKNR